MKTLFCAIAAAAASTYCTAEIFLADPTILLDSGTYYLTGTNDLEDAKAPFKIYHSKDLKNWSDKDSEGNEILAPDTKNSFAGKRFVAPQIFKRGDNYWLGYSAYRMAFAKSKSPIGPYSQDKIGEIPADSKQIDSFVLQDGSKLYVYFSYDKNGNRIYAAEIDENFSEIKNPKLCIKADSDWENVEKTKNTSTIEGPTVIKRHGKYVMFYSANDYRNPRYAVGYAVADTPLGEWKKSPDNPIIDRRISGVNGSGHGDVFFDKDGNIWYVFHTHNSNTQVHPRRTAVVRLRETIIDGVPHYSAEKDTFRFL